MRSGDAPQVKRQVVLAVLVLTLFFGGLYLFLDGLQPVIEVAPASY